MTCEKLNMKLCVFCKNGAPECVIKVYSYTLWPIEHDKRNTVLRWIGILGRTKMDKQYVIAAIRGYFPEYLEEFNKLCILS